MLRSGYSSEAAERELSVRRFAESLDAASEKALTDAGAAPALIEAIKAGAYESSPSDAHAAREQLSAQALKHAAENERLRKMDLLYQNQKVRASTAPPRPGDQGNSSTTIADQVKGDLVLWKNGGLSHYDDLTLEKRKIFALYFSAHWCGPCRKFTPKLADFYNRVAPQHPEFELLFISNDRSPFGMETSMSQMPWPAIEFGKLPGKQGLKKYAGGDSIPCLVVVDASGRVLMDTYAGKEYLGPERVLAALEASFGQGSASAVAGSR